MTNEDGLIPGQIVSDAEFLAAMARSKEPQPAGIPATPEYIDAMGKADVRELIEAHGAEVPKGATVADMRDMLKRIMFVEGAE